VHHLTERLRPLSPAPRDGDYIIYWCRIAARAYENPALDLALATAKTLGKPVFIYHALSQNYRYASDRLHTFILEGAKDLQQQSKAQNIGYAFHLHTKTNDQKVLLQLAQKAALIVTDFMPMEPFYKWDSTVSKIAPLWHVDASCVAPIWLHEKQFTRAFEFEKETKELWNQRIDFKWPTIETHSKNFLPELPFEPIDFEKTEIKELVSQCDIDHSIAPAFHTPGGTGAALTRWKLFHDSYLGSYASRRNNPLVDATSRLSSALHFGFISPFQLAREAKGHKTAGADKYLNELLTWRELAWNFCLHEKHPITIDSLPSWAKHTLHQHERDTREANYSWETLSRAQTDNPLWNAAQRQLLIHGELHNNVRMTWGKALVSWMPNATEALKVMFELNDRFALDGRDPASVGGILWCLGQFDRPFEPAVPIFGTVRPRPLSEMAKRIDVGEYSQKTRKPSNGIVKSIAIIGAGISATSAARALVDAGHSVTLFDKGKRPGGRLASHKSGSLFFDKGAANFHVEDERFARALRPLYVEKVLQQFKASESQTTNEHPFHVQGVQLHGADSMAQFLSRLQRHLNVQFGERITSLSFQNNRWRLRDEHGDREGEFDSVIVAIPAPQAATLIEAADFSLASTLKSIAYQCCWTLMLQHEDVRQLEADMVHAKHPLMRIHRQHETQLVVHASAQWSSTHVDETKESIALKMLDILRAVTGLSLSAPNALAAHLWRYAFPISNLPMDCLVNEAHTLATCGDYFSKPGVEGAFRSGQAAAGYLLRNMKGTVPISLPTGAASNQMILL
jgi:photolyase PhrII